MLKIRSEARNTDARGIICTHSLAAPRAHARRLRALAAGSAEKTESAARHVVCVHELLSQSKPISHFRRDYVRARSTLRARVLDIRAALLSANVARERGSPSTTCAKTVRPTQESRLEFAAREQSDHSGSVIIARSAHSRMVNYRLEDGLMEARSCLPHTQADIMHASPGAGVAGPAHCG